jgi:peptidyl-prolyl cis-trans isomerase SurA
VANLKGGAYSKPFIMVDESGKEVVAVVKLKSRVNGHRATMQDDYQTLQNALVAKLKEEKVGKWIREMQKKTYVRINEEWRDCEFKYPGWIK